MMRTTSDGWIAAPVPDEPGWSVEEICGGVAGSTVTTLLKCRREVPGEFLFFLAKDYSFPPDQVYTPEGLIRTLYRRTYESMFTQIRYDSIRTFKALGVTWAEAAMQMLHPRLGPLAKLERVAVVAGHVLLVSAEGSQRDVAQHWGTTIAAWMEQATFARLTPPG